jgi:hypothetical protein
MDLDPTFTATQWLLRHVAQSPEVRAPNGGACHREVR